MSSKSDNHKTEFILTPQTIVKTALLVIGIVMVLRIFKIAAPALMLIFTAFFLALALNAPVSFVARHIPGKARGNRAWATSIAFLAVVLLFLGFIASFVPPLVKQTKNFANAAPSLIQDVQQQKGSVGEFVRKYKLESQVDNAAKQVRSKLSDAGQQLFSTVQKVGGSVFAVLTVLVMAFMMLVEGPGWMRFMQELLPKAHRPRAQRLSENMYRVVKGYVNGQVTLAAMAAIVITPVFFIMGVSYPLGLMVVVFICGLIPMVGHTIGAVIATLVALFASLTAAIVVLAFYILYQQIENYLVQPRVQANSTDMSPLLVFSSVIIGVSFSGLLGGLVAIPVAGCLRVVILEYLSYRTNAKNSPTVYAEIQSATNKTT